MIRIIHISDFHLENENPSFEKKNIVKALIDDLKKYCNNNNNCIITFTGDLVDKGGKEFSNKNNVYEKFEEHFIEKILIALPQLKGRFFVVPGNHEVNRSKIDKVTEQGLKALLNCTTELSSFIKDNRINSNHLQRLEDYKKWENIFYKNNNDQSNNNFDTSFILNEENVKIGISCFNSSWLCKDDFDKGNLLLGKEQVQNAINDIEGTDLKIALMHHPIEFLKEFDKEECKKLLFKNYDLLLTGHVHELSSTYTYDLTGNIFISIANSTIADNTDSRKFINGYTVIDVYPNDKIITHYRKYIENHNNFVANTDIGTEDGKKEFPLLKNEKLKIYERNYQVITSIENRFLEKLDEHIIVSNAYTDINCTIENLFVEPTILNNPQKNLDEDEEVIKYSIDDIIGDEKHTNYLIFGLKESGKTLLLDKMFIDSLKKFSHYQKIPVLLSFGQIEKDMVKLLREFLGIASKDINDYIKSNQLIIFIDDIRFSEENNSKTEYLKKFVEEYPNVQIVATTTQVFENIISQEYFDNNIHFNFNFGFIQQLNSKEIKLLVTKWFSGREIDLQENMEKLIKTFVDFGLPKNPLSVTLFLWIFEKQEKKPINKSVLVEIFIENLLEKTKIENIYSETFDFGNKRRLLSFIAKYMHDNGNKNISYAIDYSNLLSYASVYIKQRAEIQPQKVLDDLIKRGILHLDENNFVAFKSAFFFHYFLALHFDIDENFKEYVFENDNYLNYIEEITYYTGVKRDDHKILQFSQDKLMLAFSDLNQDIRENYERVDKILESNNKKNSFSFQIEDKNINKKVTEKQLEHIYDDKLSNAPVKKEVVSKAQKLNTDKNIDLVLKLSSIILKNSEEVDDFELKKEAYSNILVSSIAFLMLYRDSLLSYYTENKKQPDNFPKNINFNLFIKVLPLIHQVMIYDWLGSQKLRPIIINKIESDRLTLNISELEKYISIFIYGDIKGSDYPNVIKKFVKETKSKYLKDLSFLKILSYYKLRNNSEELDKQWLNLLAEIKTELGQLYKKNKGEFIKKIEGEKKTK